MLSFLFNSTMLLVAAGAFAMMIALRRHKRFKKFTQWGVFALALIAGSALGVSIVGDWITGLLLGLLSVLGVPGVAVGIVALFGLIVMVGDLLDGTPDGRARTQALVLPTLLLATGGQLGLMGGELVGGASQAGAALMGSLIGLGG